MPLFKCKGCGYTSISKGSLQRHIERKIKCNELIEYMTEPFFIVDTTHKPKPTLKAKFRSKSGSKSKNMKDPDCDRRACPKCLKVFATQRGMKQHLTLICSRTSFNPIIKCMKGEFYRNYVVQFILFNYSSIISSTDAKRLKNELGLSETIVKNNGFPGIDEVLSINPNKTEIVIKLRFIFENRFFHDGELIYDHATTNLDMFIADHINSLLINPFENFCQSRLGNVTIKENLPTKSIQFYSRQIKHIIQKAANKTSKNIVTVDEFPEELDEVKHKQKTEYNSCEPVFKKLSDICQQCTCDNLDDDNLDDKRPDNKNKRLNDDNLDDDNLDDDNLDDNSLDYENEEYSKKTKYSKNLTTKDSKEKQTKKTHNTDSNTGSYAVNKHSQASQHNINKHENSHNTNTNTNNSNNVINSNNSNNSNVTNNIYINDYGNESLNHITHKEMRKIIKTLYGALPSLVEKVHIDNEHNRNVFISHPKDGYALVFKKNDWEIKALGDVIEDIITTNTDRIYDYVIANKDYFCVNTLSKLDTIFTKISDGDSLYRKYKKEVQYIFINKRSDVKKYYETSLFDQADKNGEIKINCLMPGIKKNYKSDTEPTKKLSGITIIP